MNIEYKHETGFKNFYTFAKGKKIVMAYDKNTAPFADELKKELSLYARIADAFFDDAELLPTEDKCDFLFNNAKNCDYLLAVGSGTLNDMAKSVSCKLNISCGVLATAASMDGYCSSVAALMEGGKKITEQAQCPSDVLIDTDIICAAPKIMTAAGFGDIVGKYTALTDWKMANFVKGEQINLKAMDMMKSSLDDCMAGYENLTKYEPEALSALMKSLIVAGLAMAESGNSRPASGSEHHISHFLEMDFIRRGETVPLHGLKVALGTIVSIEIYNYIKNNKIKFNNCEKVYGLVSELPTVEEIRAKLKRMGCPTRFSEIGVRRETMEDMIENAYAVRDRYTVLTLMHELNLTEDLKPMIMSKYY